RGCSGRCVFFFPGVSGQRVGRGFWGLGNLLKGPIVNLSGMGNYFEHEGLRGYVAYYEYC
ncbi:hypothetical protein, partial [Escherichia coli]|uniref:hypothetical protein n=1 Tax=Escherichia coli TaxID=562 RepID=UPI00197E8AD0